MPMQAAGNLEQHSQQQQTEAVASAGQQAQVQLTDGWYGVRAVLDVPLTHLLQRGVLQVGECSCESWSKAVHETFSTSPHCLVRKLHAGTTRSAIFISNLMRNIVIFLLVLFADTVGVPNMPRSNTHLYASL